VLSGLVFGLFDFTVVNLGVLMYYGFDCFDVGMIVLACCGVFWVVGLRNCGNLVFEFLGFSDILVFYGFVVILLIFGFCCLFGFCCI